MNIDVDRFISDSDTTISHVSVDEIKIILSGWYRVLLRGMNLHGVFWQNSSPFSIDQDEAPYPLHIGILGPNAVVPSPNILTHPVKQAHGFLIATYDAHTIPKKWPPGGLFRGISMAYDAASGSITSVMGLIPQARR